MNDLCFFCGGRVYVLLFELFCGCLIEMRLFMKMKVKVNVKLIGIVLLVVVLFSLVVLVF